MWLGASMNLGWALSCLLLCSALARYGALGLAGSRLLAYLLHGVWTAAFAFYFLAAPKTCTAVEACRASQERLTI